MAIYKDVVVNIRRLTAALAVPNQGLCLVLTTESTAAYKEYSGLTAVATDFPATTRAYKIAAALFAQEPAIDKIAIVGVEFSSDFSEVIDALNTMFARESNWVYLVSDVQNEAQIAQLAAWATPNQRFYFAAIDINAVDSITNPVSDRVVFMAHDVPGSYPEAAWVGKCSTFTPGSATWMFKALNGIQPVAFDDQMTAVENIHEKHYNTYVSKYGINMTSNGFCTSGEFIDVMLGVDWIKTDMELRIQRLLVNTPKIPYDNTGIAQISSQIDATLRQATEIGIIRRGEGGLGEYTINIPDIANINPNDIASRILKDITFEAYLAGAIHHVIINGVVQY